MQCFDEVILVEVVWKATGADKHIKYKGAVVGYRKALVFYTGTPSESTKTDWIMHEYRVRDAPQRIRKNADDLTVTLLLLPLVFSVHQLLLTGFLRSHHSSVCSY